MNSMILSFIMSFCASFINMFKRSKTYKLFNRIYDTFSKGWGNSRIVSWVKRDGDTDHISLNSRFSRICKAPFTFYDFLRRKIGTWLSSKIEKSCIVHMCNSILHNMLALNTRFFGVMILGLQIGRTVMEFLRGGISFGWVSIAMTVVGVVLLLININITQTFATSRVMAFIQKTAGFDVHYDIFKKRWTSGGGRLILSLLIGLLMGVLTMYSTLLAIAVPMGLFGLFVVLYSPIVGVFFAIFAAPFVPTIVLALLCLLTLKSLFIHSLINPRFKWKFDGMGVGIIALILVFLISSITSFALAKSLMVWAMYFIFMAFYFVIINTVKTKKQLYGLLKVFVIAGAFVALYGLMQYMFGWNTNNAWIDESMFENETMRVYSTLENPNVLGEYLLLVLPIAGVFFCKYKINKLPKWAYGLVTGMLFICLILTQSRGCWLGFALALVIFVTFSKGRLWGLLPIVIALLPFILPQTVVERLMSIGNMEDSSTSYRVFIWFGTLAMLKDFWLGGIGMGEAAFNSVYPFYSYNAIVAPHSHNIYLQLISESGICALVLFIIVMVVFLKKMHVVYRRKHKTSIDSMMALAIGCAVIGFLLQGMFDYVFYNYRVMAMFFMLLAMGMSLKYVTAHEDGQKGDEI